MKEITVLSLFNGLGGAALALSELNVPIKKLYSSEIDKFANKAAQLLFPDTIQLGDITQWDTWEDDKDVNFADIDILFAGFPCQAWSMAGKQKGDNDPRGALVHDLLDIWSYTKILNPDLKIMFENVAMKKEFMDYINNLFGVEPVMINAALVTAQNRKRNYWMNWEVNQPEDLCITWGDVRETGVNEFYYTEKGLQWMARHSQRKNKKLSVWSNEEKAQMVEASHFKSYSAQRFFGVCDLPSDESVIAAMRGRYLVDGKRNDKEQGKNGNTAQFIEFRHDKKSNALTTVQKDNVVVPFTLPNRTPVELFFFRYITPKECMRLQGLPTWAIDKLINSGISNSQLYKITGNGWAHPVIVHNLKALLKTGWMK